MVAWFAVSVASIAMLASLLAVLYALNCWRRVSASTISPKTFREMQIAQADLQSSMQDLLASHARLRSRVGMRELREKRAAEDMDQEGSDDARAPLAGSKATLRRKLGLFGPEAARNAQQIHSGRLKLNGK